MAVGVGIAGGGGVAAGVGAAALGDPARSCFLTILHLQPPFLCKTEKTVQKGEKKATILEEETYTHKTCLLFFSPRT